MDSDSVVTHVGFVSEGVVGFDGIEPLFLQGVGANFLGQTDPATFLREVDEGSTSFAGDHFEGGVELIATIAAEGLDQVAGKATAMHAYEGGLGAGGGKVTHENGEGFLGFMLNLVDGDLEVSELGGEICFRHAGHEFFVEATMGDELFDGNDFELMLFGEGEEFIAIRAITLFVEDFAQNSGGGESGHASQVDSGFGMTGATQDATFHGDERKDVSGFDEISWSGIRFGETADGFCAFGGSDPGFTTGVIDGGHEGRLQGGRVVCDEGAEFESITDISQDGCAKLSVPAKHEVDGFGSDKFGSADVVPLIFTIFIVENDNNFTKSDGVDGGLDRAEGSGHDAFRW